MSNPASNDESDTSIISRGEATSLLAHEMGNLLMVVQSRLDALRSRYREETGFEEIQKACSHSALVLRGAVALLGNTTQSKSMIPLGETLEGMLASLIRFSNHSLGLRTHEECRVLASTDSLQVTLSQVLNHFEAKSENPELYIEVYTSEYDGGDFGVISICGDGHLSESKSTWNMLEALMHLQGGELTIDEESGNPRVCLLFPIFKKHDTIFALRNQSETSTAIIVEDNKDVADSVRMNLQALGIPQIETFVRPQEALQWLNKHTPALCITDYSMFGMNGIDFLREAQGALASSTVAIMSGIPLDDYKSDLDSLTIPVRVLTKPLKGDDLMNLVMESLSGPPTKAKEEELQSFSQTMRIPNPHSQKPEGFTGDA